MEKEVLKLIDYLYSDNKPPDEPKYKRQQQMIAYARSIYGDYGEGIQTELSQLLNGYAIANLTDWNYESCFRFKILLHPHVPYTIDGKASAIELVQKLGGCTYFLILEVSALGPYYEYYFSRRIYDDSTHELLSQVSECPFSADQEGILKKVVRYCEGKGFQKLNKEVLDRVVLNIGLELAEEGEVTIYNCLFADTYHSPGA